MTSRDVFSDQPRAYRVKVGHAEVTVYARSRTEAIQRGRMQLSIEIPRMWDVIQNIDDSKFRVDPAHELVPDPSYSGRAETQRSSLISFMVEL